MIVFFRSYFTQKMANNRKYEVEDEETIMAVYERMISRYDEMENTPEIKHSNKTKRPQTIDYSKSVRSVPSTKLPFVMPRRKSSVSDLKSFFNMK